MDYGLLGKRLRQERQKLNITQETLAEKIDISNVYISQIERGERNLSLDTLIKLANELGITVDYLLQDYYEKDDDYFLNEIRLLLKNLQIKDKQLALDLIKLVFSQRDILSSQK